MQASTDEKKAVSAVKDLEKLYEGLSFDQYSEEHKAKMIDARKNILAKIATANGNLEDIGSEIRQLETMMKEAKAATKKPNAYATKAHPTPDKLPELTPTLKPDETKRELLDPPVKEVASSTSSGTTTVTPSSPHSDITPNESKTGGKKNKKRKTKRSRKAKGKESKRYPRSKKHYNQKGGAGCSPVITPAKVNPFQGFAWKGGDVNTWPGVKGVSGASNFYSPNQYNNQPDRYPDMVSGI